MLSITECAIHPKELYLNYVRAMRILIFGSVTGAFSTSPMQCTSTIIITLSLSAVLYLINKPYPDNLQNLLLGSSDIATCMGTLFLSIIHFVTIEHDKSLEDSQEYL